MFDLPEPVPYRLSRPPLVQALVQVRYPVVASLGTVAGVAPLQKRLGQRLPYMEPVSSNMSLQIGPSGAIVEPGPPDGWQLADDEGHKLLLAPGAANLVVDNRYKGVQEFSELLEFCLSGIVEAEAIRRCTRLGVRYLSVAPPSPDNEYSWMDWFRPEVQGWSSRNLLNAKLEASANRVQIKGGLEGEFSDFPSPAQGLITTGWFPAGAVISGLPPIPLDSASFVVDFDFFVEGVQSFSVEKLVDQFKKLHSQMDRFFHWSLTPKGAEHFGLEDK
ncbi:TIGR04255 family protein [Streptomyces maoxianensis]|uniref:TIGR04255 family protein n=1 Tax=Streptomyces maoxianensis TaxID=1459942 RepID=A0ABV9G209_9ACTN